MKRILSVILLALAVAAAPAAASTGNTGPKPWDPVEDGPRPTEITSSVKLVIAEVSDDGTIVFTDEDEARYEIKLDDGIELRAKRKKDFDGRRKLAFSDLAPGQVIKLTYLTENRQVVRIDVLEKAKKTKKA